MTTMGSLRNVKRQYDDYYSASSAYIYIAARPCIPNTGRFTMTPEGRDFSRTLNSSRLLYISIYSNIRILCRRRRICRTTVVAAAPFGHNIIYNNNKDDDDNNNNVP